MLRDISKLTVQVWIQMKNGKTAPIFITDADSEIAQVSVLLTTALPRANLTINDVKKIANKITEVSFGKDAGCQLSRFECVQTFKDFNPSTNSIIVICVANNEQSLNKMLQNAVENLSLIHISEPTRPY